MARTTRAPARPTGPPPAVTPKGHATRELILQTAAEAFTERGYAATTLSELIARTGLAKGAFYFHFASKEQLAFAVLEDKQRQWIGAVERDVLSRPTAVDQLRALGPALIRLHRDDPSAYSATRLSRDLRRVPGIGEHVRGQLRDWIRLVAGIVAGCQRDGALPAGLEPEALATILVAATDGLKDLSDVLDAPSRARRGFEQRLRGLAELIEVLLVSR